MENAIDVPAYAAFIVPEPNTAVLRRVDAGHEVLRKAIGRGVHGDLPAIVTTGTFPGADP
jgi:hypothetical protein